jgi:hypothetical protein
MTLDFTCNTVELVVTNPEFRVDMTLEFEAKPVLVSASANLSCHMGVSFRMEARFPRRPGGGGEKRKPRPRRQGAYLPQAPADPVQERRQAYLQRSITIAVGPELSNNQEFPVFISVLAGQAALEPAWHAPTPTFTPHEFIGDLTSDDDEDAMDAFMAVRALRDAA